MNKNKGVCQTQPPAVVTMKHSLTHCVTMEQWSSPERLDDLRQEVSKMKSQAEVKGNIIK